MEENILQQETIMSKITVVRGRKIMLDMDLAELYKVETKILKRQVRRNIERFPPDFMFELTEDEWQILRCQIGTSSWGGTRYMPMAFTEQGVSMLSSVLSSPLAIQVNIQIIRIFHLMRDMIRSNKDLSERVTEIESRLEYHARRSISCSNALSSSSAETRSAGR
jgi:hypothetical protein